MEKILGGETFFAMNLERRTEVRNWYSNQPSPTSLLEEIFFEVLEKSLKVVNYDYEISIIEPSFKDGSLYFKIGEPIKLGLKCDVWEKLAMDFDPKHNSRMTTVYEAIMFYTWRVAKGYMTLTEAAIDASSLGNYSDSPYSTGKIENAGMVIAGGFADGIGNTCKIVKHEYGYGFMNGAFENLGKIYPVCSIRWNNEIIAIRYGTPIISRDIVDKKEDKLWYPKTNIFSAWMQKR